MSQQSEGRFTWSLRVNRKTWSGSAPAIVVYLLLAAVILLCCVGTDIVFLGR